MTILLLGATGRTGRFLLIEALEKGHSVHVLVRDKRKIDIFSPLLFIFEGTPADERALQRAIEGCDAVLSTLNISRKSDFPWSPLRTPPYFLSETMALLIRLCQERSIRRIIITTAWGVNETKTELPGWFRWLIEKSNIGVAYADHERQENLLRKTNMEWTLVRPVGLTNGREYKPVETIIENRYLPSFTVSRCNVARFMINELIKEDFIRKAVVISKGIRMRL